MRVYFAYLHQPVCIVADDQEYGGIGDELPNAQKIALPKRKWYHSKRWFWMGFTNYCSKELLDEIAECWEFEIGLVQFTSIENADVERCRSFYDADDTPTFERLYLTCDGLMMGWENPPEAIKAQLEPVLRAIAEKAGWDVVVETTDQAKAESGTI